MSKLQSFSHLKHGLVKSFEAFQTLRNLKLVFQALESFEVV
jgi:hypothetical protein